MGNATLLFVDERCSLCREKENAYRMVGSCLNCKAEPILVMFSVGHQSTRAVCPKCGCKEVMVTRLATDDEIPAGSGS